ncbi:MAG: hypothetical protein ACYTF7_01215 [Planctomycetota bacterium]|jgi:hypothetical protein
MFPQYRTVLKKSAIATIGLLCVVAAGVMLWFAMTPERASGTQTWVLFSLLGLFVLPLLIGGMLVHERAQSRRARSGGKSESEG